MLRSSRFILWLALAGLGLGLLALPAAAADSQSSAATSQSTAQATLVDARDRLAAVLVQLSKAKSLSSSEIVTLRATLDKIYDQIDTANLLLGGKSVPGPQTPDNTQWQAFSAASTSSAPHDAKFSGWKSGYNLAMSFGTDEDIYVTVTNGTYTAETHIKNGFKGAVKTKASTSDNGQLIINVQDSLGSHDFRIDNGGLGPVYLRNAGSGVGDGKTTSPVGDSTGTVPQGKWDTKYRAQVSSGQTAASPSVEWLAGQIGKRQYVSDSLRELGEFLRQMEGLQSQQRLGLLHYFKDSQERSLDIPDPRVNVLDFINLMNKVYALDSAGDWYQIELDQ